MERKLGFERLEDRELLSVDLAPAEQLFLELLNRARANPAAEAARFQVDLNEGLAPGTISTAPKQPLAPNQALTNAIRGHLADMLANDFFSHTGSTGSSISQRINAAGYVGSPLGENLGWQGTTATVDVPGFVASIHQSLFVDAGVPGRGHRVNMLNPDFEEIGPGVLSGSGYRPEGATTDFNAVLVGQDLGARTGNSFITGVVYDDNRIQNDDFFSVGEEMVGATVTATGTPGTFTDTTGPGGGYHLQLPAGTYQVTVSGGSLAGVIVRDGITVGSTNVQLDFLAEQAALPTLSVDDVLVVEGSGGNSAFFSVRLSAASTQEVTVSYTTSAQSATPGSDYAAMSGSLSFTPGQTVRTVSVPIVGDAVPEPDETFELVLSAPANATLADDRGAATIQNDDAATPGLVGPGSATLDVTPTFAWNAAAGADRYDVWVNDVTAGVAQVIRNQNVTGTSLVSTTLVSGRTYRWWVRSITSSGVAGTWSSALDFTPNSTLQPALTNPGSSTLDRTPTFSWQALAGAVRYDLWVNDLTGGIGQVIRNQNVTGTSHTAATSLVAGRTYRWWVRAFNDDGIGGAWTSGRDFTVDSTLTPTPAGPPATTLDRIPTFTWSAVAGASRYDLWVNDVTGGVGQVIRDQNVAGTTRRSPITLVGGRTYRWWVQAIDDGGNVGPWSAAQDFRVDTTLAPTLAGPPTTLDRTPTFSWSTVPGAATYDVWVNDVTAGIGQVIRNPSVAGTSLASPISLVSGRTYRWWVRAIDDDGAAGSWSGSRDFTVNTTLSPTLTGPAGSGATSQPTFIWEALAGAARHDLWVNDLSGSVSQVIRDQNVATSAFVSPITLVSGRTYRWWVRAANDSGDLGTWSAAMDFTVALADPALGPVPREVPDLDPKAPGPGRPAHALPAREWEAVDEALRIVVGQDPVLDELIAEVVPVADAIDRMDAVAALDMVHEQTEWDRRPASAVLALTLPAVARVPMREDRRVHRPAKFSGEGIR